MTLRKVQRFTDDTALEEALQRLQTSVDAELRTVAKDPQRLKHVSTKTEYYEAKLGELVPCDTSGGNFTVMLPECLETNYDAAVAVLLLTPGGTISVRGNNCDVGLAAGGTVVSSATYVHRFFSTPNGWLRGY